MIVEKDDYLAHYGILRKSGRYPWGSGENPYQRSKSFLAMVQELKDQGLSDIEIARGLQLKSADGVEFNTATLRSTRTLARAEKKMHDIATAEKLARKGLSNTEIGKKMGINESSVRELLKPGEMDRQMVTKATADMLRRQVKEKGYVDVGAGVEHHIGVSGTRLKTALAILKDEGYTVANVQVNQLGTKPGQKTGRLVLAKPGSDYKDIKQNLHDIKLITEMSDDGGRTFYGLKEPLSIDSKRIQIISKEDGGDKADGLIYVRPGVSDVSIGENKYAQVRILVDNSHFIKGMAVYKEGLPKGIDLAFNTNKERTPNKLDALKGISEDPDNPFGSQIAKQIGERNEKGELVKVTSAMNIIYEEGDWDKWSRKLSTQVLSKQSPALAQKQLDMTYDRKRAELEEIKQLTNPVVKRALLRGLADSADASAVHLEANRIPRSSWHVILPFESLKDTEVYAPNFNDGERVALIRYPHGGTFEIPDLIVNNRSRLVKSVIGGATDAIGINSNVANRLSGADFDGDTVLVIPNASGAIKSTPALERLKGFDPRQEYRGYEGMTKMTEEQKQYHMGTVSNLITDMTIKGAPFEEIANAVRHSMVVIDAVKHGLDYKRSARDHQISKLTKRYRSKEAGGPTIISIAESPINVPARKMNYKIDPSTGKKIWIETGESWPDKKTGKTVYRTQSSVKLAEAENARSLISKPGTKIESVYADHSNRLKALANEARKEYINTKSIPYSPSARKHYYSEYQSLAAKVKRAESFAPLERQAQTLANKVVAQKVAAKPEMSKDERKKIEGQTLAEMRRRTGSSRGDIIIEPKEWEAIQAGALTNNMLTNVIRYANQEKVRELATPKSTVTMTPSKIARAQSMLDQGYTQAEVADALGVSVTTLKNNL